MSEKLRVGVVGGGIGQAHIRALQSLPDQFEVVVLCGLEAEIPDIAARYRIPHFCTDIEEVCRLDDLDVIHVCTPSNLHVEHVQRALAAGKHVVCEKPVSGSLQQVDALIRAEAASEKRVMPIFQYRFGHGLQKLKFLVEQGVAGRAYLTTVETAWRRRAGYYTTWRGKWQTELGGALLTLAIHAHDTLMYILGPARRVLAHTATLVNAIETEDCVAASLEMADGSLASLAVTTGSTVEISRHRFCFSNLTAESNTEPYNNTAEPWTLTGDSPEAEAQIEETLARFVPLPEGFAGQFYRFYQALQNDSVLPVTLADARASLELVTAIYYSAQTGQAVQLPIGEDHPMYASWWPD
jgi:predicted dehydrogenase